MNVVVWARSIFFYPETQIETQSRSSSLRSLLRRLDRWSRGTKTLGKRVIETTHRSACAIAYNTELDALHAHPRSQSLRSFGQRLDRSLIEKKKTLGLWGRECLMPIPLQVVEGGRRQLPSERHCQGAETLPNYVYTYFGPIH